MGAFEWDALESSDVWRNEAGSTVLTEPREGRLKERTQ